MTTLLDASALLGDRACMATALTCGFEVLTADQSWLTLKLSGLTVKSLRY